MIRPLYTDLLTVDERRDITQLAIKVACARAGIKEAQWPDIAGGIEKGLLTFSVLTGIPIGIAGHMLSRAAKSDELAQREQQAKIKYYRDVTKELEHGLVGGGSPETTKV